jgi:DHA1 family bicyclomycin/chloramphenicol resistance-like MFS transporter
MVGFGNGLLLPTAIAGAESIRPQVAGTASGMTGFIQMAIGAAAAQLGGHIVAGAASALPVILLMLAFGLLTAAAFLILVRRARD